MPYRLMLPALVVLGLSCLPTFGRAQVDVSVDVRVASSVLEVGDSTSVTVAVHNEGSVAQGALTITLDVPSGLETVGPREAAVSWSVSGLGPGNSDSVQVAVRAVSGGAYQLSAELTDGDPFDWDSAPGNGDVREDDYAVACLSVPVTLPCGARGVLRAPGGEAAYVWRRDGEVLAGRTSDTLEVGTGGSYTYVADDAGGCAAVESCPVEVREGACAYDLALRAVGADLPGGDGRRIALRIFNQGEGTVDGVRVYVTANDYARVSEASLAAGWTLLGDRVERTWAGLLAPGDSLLLELDVEVLEGGRVSDYAVFAEIAEFSAAGVRLDDADSTPDDLPDNDLVVDDALDGEGDEDDSDTAQLTDCRATHIDGNVPVCAGGPLTLTASHPPADVNYAWSSLTAEISCATCSSVEVRAEVGAEVTLQTTTLEGCVERQTVRLAVRSCIDSLTLAVRPGVEARTCIPLAAEGTVAFADEAALPPGLTRELEASDGRACVRVESRGKWGGVARWRLAVCEYGTCDTLALTAVVSPPAEVVDYGGGGVACLGEQLQVRGEARAVRLVGELPGLKISVSPEASECLLVEPTADSYPGGQVLVVHEYEVEGFGLSDTTQVLVAPLRVCDLRVFGASDYEVTQGSPGAAAELCLPGDFAVLSSARYTLDGTQVDLRSEGCGVRTAKTFSLSRLPDDFEDADWTIDEYGLDGDRVLRRVAAPTLDDVLAEFMAADPGALAVYDADARRIEVTGYERAPTSLRLKHGPSGTRLRLQPSTVESVTGYAIAIPAGIPAGDYVLAAADAGGCPDSSILRLRVVDDAATPPQTVALTDTTAALVLRGRRRVGGEDASAQAGDIHVRGPLVHSGFSPNGDGVNDYLAIEGLEAYPAHSLRVFTANGRPIYASGDYRGEWDGTTRGRPLPAGTYFYMLTYGLDGETITGYVQLAR